jgi:8-oxo-dGTP pyrophosphatase MutT (NUDIX family)
MTIHRPVSPMPAASVLLVRDAPWSVLMVKRHAKSFFSSALVFPGGVVDPEDSSDAWLQYVSGQQNLSREERALRIAGCRELFEETGVLLARQSIAARRGAGFFHQIQAAGGTLALDALRPFAHWITPEGSRKRFDTHFYLCCAPAGSEASCDGTETVTCEWHAPAALVARAEAGDAFIMLPTHMNLKHLAESQDFAAAAAAAAKRRIVTVTPRFERRAGGDVILIPAEAGYGITEYPARTGATAPLSRD